MSVAYGSGDKGKAAKEYEPKIYDTHPLMISKGNKPRTGKVKNCKACDKEIYARPYNIATKNFCDTKCYNQFQSKKKAVPCVICGKEKMRSPSYIKFNKKYCSPVCAKKGLKPKTVGTRRKGLLARVAVLSKRYARLRDCGGVNGFVKCISCPEVKQFKDLDGGHFIPSTCSYWKFDERNINAQCQKCNRFLHGNVRHYYKGMVEKYGQEVVDEIEAHEFETKKWNYEELSVLYDYYSAEIKKYEN